MKTACYLCGTQDAELKQLGPKGQLVCHTCYMRPDFPPCGGSITINVPTPKGDDQ